MSPDADGRFKGISIPELPWLKDTKVIKGTGKTTQGIEDDLERLAKQQEPEEQGG